ncbi:pectate lyase [Xylophilus ampelinus]|uniref:pectate lyase n=1 Tax=Xylophilus ampelinus TaxID=54067 RepID=A0A318SGB3_9BURK|nr:pectate lyase [Xylophilus ampelinus]MCS4510409.1 pectate lyase [Xylophilus ampelinus]PYE77863.1 pectate lyase-like protein [Xylophilus ampelinus]
MNSVEAIGQSDTDPYRRYNAYPSSVDGMNQSPTQGDQTAQQLMMAMVMLSLLSQAFSQQNGGGNPFSGGSQQPSDPLLQFLNSLLNPTQQEGGGAGEAGGADGGQSYGNGSVGGNGYGGDSGGGGSGGTAPGVGNKNHGSVDDGYETGGRRVSPQDEPSGKSKAETQPGGKPDKNQGTPATTGTSPSPTGKTNTPTQITPSTRISQPNGQVMVHEPIVVKAGQTFDGGGKLYSAGPELGDGGQSESQKPVFVLEPGATLQNVQVQGADGVHANGDAALKNVWWRDVGEDAFTLKKPGHVTVEGGGALHASDKVFQINAPGSISINGFYAEDFDKLVRQNGGKDFPLTVTLNNIATKDAGEALVRTDSPQCKIYLSNVDPSTAKNDVLAQHGAVVEGAVKAGYKPYTG